MVSPEQFGCVRDRDQQDFSGVHKVSDKRGGQLRLFDLQRSVALLRLDLDDDAAFLWSVHVESGDAVNDCVAGHSKLIEEVEDRPCMASDVWIDAGQG